MNEYDVVIIGAGFSGVFSAIEVAKQQGLKVLLLEAGPDIIPESSSSFNECYKLHTGLHYAADLKTATHCLKNSIYFAKTYKDFLLGAEDASLPWRRGRFYIPSNSLVSAEETLKVAEVLKDKYSILCRKYSSDKVFGEPEQFLTILEPKDYSDLNANLLSNTDAEIHNPQEAVTIQAAYETPESQIDLPKIKKYFQNTFIDHPSITVKLNTKALHIAQLNDELGYIINTKDSTTGNNEKFKTKSVINCTWQNIEEFEQQLGYFVPNDNLIRTKISIQVQLPPCLTHMNTCIFATGPFISITNLADNTAILTSEKVTNVGYYKAGTHNYNSRLPIGVLTDNQALLEQQLHDPEIDESYQQFLQRSQQTYLKLIQNRLTIHEGEGKILAEKILADCSDYFPALTEATILNLRVGHVKMPDPKKDYNHDSIHNIKSSIHARQDSGANAKDLCYWSNSGMKMTYVLENAENLSADLAKHLLLRETLKVFLEEIHTAINKRLAKTVNPDNVKWEWLVNPLLYTTYKKILFDNLKTWDTVEKRTSYKLTLVDEICNKLGLKCEVKTDLAKHLLLREKLENFLNDIHTAINKRLAKTVNPDNVKWEWLVNPLLYTTYKKILFDNLKTWDTVEKRTSYKLTLVDEICNKLGLECEVKELMLDVKLESPIILLDTTPNAAATPLGSMTPVDASLTLPKLLDSLSSKVHALSSTECMPQ